MSLLSDIFVSYIFEQPICFLCTVHPYNIKHNLSIIKFYENYLENNVSVTINFVDFFIAGGFRRDRQGNVPPIQGRLKLSF